MSKGVGLFGGAKGMIKYQFNQKKAAQATAALLRRAGQSKTESYMKIMKILYYAERESFRQSGRPITGDRIFAMRYGPVLSNVLDLIRDRTFGAKEWADFIVTEHNNIRLAEDPGNDELSPFELDILHKVWNEHKDADPFDLATRTHDLPEYAQNPPPEGSSVEIPVEDILRAVGRTDIEKIANDAEQMVALARLYG